MSEPTRQDDPAHIPNELRGEQPERPRQRLRHRARRLAALGVVTAAMLVPATAAAAVVEHHHLHPHTPPAVAVTTAAEDRLRAARAV